MDHAQAYVSISMLLIFLFVGVPLWWNTTKVYRASLPSDEISMLQNSSFKLKVYVNIFSQAASDIMFSNSIDGAIFFEYQNIIADVSDYETCCSKMGEHSNVGFTFSFCAFQSPDDFSKQCLDSLNTVVSMKENSQNEIESVVNKHLSVYLPIQKLKLNFKNSELPLSFGYRINFVLAVSNPEDFVEDWNPDIAVDVFKNYLSNYEYLGPFTFSSQVLYYPDIKQKPKKMGNFSYYTKSKLPQLINPLESRLNTYTSFDKTIQFVVYIPPKEYSPLYIGVKTSKSDSKVSYNELAFHSPRWGSMYFYNRMNNEKTILPNDEIMNIFLNHFNELAGIKLKNFNMNDNIVSSFLFPSKHLKVSKLFEHLYTSLSTLQSLLKLLNEIPNIVISDEVAGFVKDSLNHMLKAIDYMNYSLLDEAYDSAKLSYMLSEKAFFDSSLLGLLYFPDDQKYAIYVPLFLPISIPVVISCFKAIKMVKASWFGNDKTKVD